MSDKGVITILSGFSGAGKGTIVNELVNQYGYKISISATTRKPRNGEQDGVHYFFKTVEEFEEMIHQGKLMEYAKYVGNYYGTPSDYVMDVISQGNDILLEIEMQGALQIKERFPDVNLVFITPPSFQELRSRLEGRGTETQDVIESRLQRAAQECEYMSKYDYIIVNDNLSECVDQIHHLIQSLHWKKENQCELINQITKDFFANHS